MKNIIVFILLAKLLVSCSSKRTENNPEERNEQSQTVVTLTEAQIKNAGIVTGKAEMKAISAMLRVNGKIDVPPQNMISVSFPLGGYLKSTDLLPGMQVRKGQIIGVLEDPQYIQLQQDYLSAKIKLEFLKKEYERQKELNASKASSDKVFQQTESDFLTQKVLVKALSEKLSLIGLNPEKINEDYISKSVNICSPINGFVSKVNVNIGKYVSPTEVLFELINPLDIHLSLAVFQKDISLLAIGQNVTTYTVNNPDKKYQAKIILISRDISPDGSVEVHCHFANYDKTLVPGMFMNAEIQTHLLNAVVLPADAVVLYEKKQYVFLEKERNLYEIAEITTGVTENGFMTITSDNNNMLLHQNVVLKNAYALLMKMKNTGDE
ncbi:MAG: efflux RND transporter periplasmic adaptor subunit [Ferruginibacter sp.]